MRRSARKIGNCGGGALRHEVGLYAPTTPTTSGETKPTWSLVATLLAEKKYLINQGRETISGDAVVGLAKYRLTWRYRGDAEPGYRLRAATTRTADDVFEIMSVGDPDGSRQFEVADCNLLEST